MPQDKQRSKPSRSKAARSSQPQPLKPGEVRMLPLGTPPPPDLYAPTAPVEPTPPPVLAQQEVSDIGAHLVALRDLELHGLPEPIAGYDPLRTPEYLAQLPQEASLVKSDSSSRASAPAVPPELLTSAAAFQPHPEMEQLRRELELVRRERDLATREADLARREATGAAMMAEGALSAARAQYDPRDPDEWDKEEEDDEDESDSDDEDTDEDDLDEEEGDDEGDLDDDLTAAFGPEYPGARDPSFPPLAPPLPASKIGGGLSGWLDLSDYVGQKGERYPQFKGWKIRVRTGISAELLDSISAIQESVSAARRAGARGISIAPMLNILRDMLDAWNFRMPDGRPMPQPPEGVRYLRDDLLLATLGRAMQEITPSKRRSRHSKRR